MDYPFADLVKSLMTKYSELPEGWQKTDAWVESEARRLSKAVSTLKAEEAAAEEDEADEDGDSPGRPPPAKLQAQLTDFYAKHDISKIPEVQKLLSDYPFDQVVKSLQQKYGALPAGWEQYAETKTKWSLDMGGLSLSPTLGGIAKSGFSVPGFS